MFSSGYKYCNEVIFAEEIERKRLSDNGFVPCQAAVFCYRKKDLIIWNF